MTASTRPAQDEFLALILADQEWLRAEFEAIIAAGWSSTPPAPPPTVSDLLEPVAPGPWGALAERSQGTAGRQLWCPPAGVEPGRQRSPPAHHSSLLREHIPDQKGR